ARSSRRPTGAPRWRASERARRGLAPAARAPLRSAAAATTVTALTGRIAVLGFGNQGAAHATLLRQNGCTVVVGARADGAGARRAADAGFEVLTLADALAAADIAAVLLPDEALPERWDELRAKLREGHTLVFAHGFNLLYGGIDTPPGCDVVLVSPT